jgi:hypothetical protein
LDYFPGTFQEGIAAVQAGYLAGEGFLDALDRIGWDRRVRCVSLVEQAFACCCADLAAVRHGIAFVGRLFPFLGGHLAFRGGSLAPVQGVSAGG